MSNDLDNAELEQNDAGNEEPSTARGGSRASREGETRGEGPTSSNTGPSGTKVYRHGVDSLYLSFKGVLSVDAISLLEEKKKAAQSEDVVISSTAQIEVAGHVFEVKDKGGRGFAYIIEDNAFKISLNQSVRNKMPMAFAKISSECLTLCGYEAAFADLAAVVLELGTVYEPATISRIDLCVDFSSDFDFEALHSDCFVTKCEDFALFEKKPHLTGVSVGMGGDISFRLYDKTEELRKKPRPYLQELWEKAAWNRTDKVWRAEFEIKREALKGLGINILDEFSKAGSSLWNYLTTNWLRIVKENPEDSHRDRWPSHPFWVEASKAFGTENIYPLAQRFKNQRLPDEGRLFRRLASDFASLMALLNLSDGSISTTFSAILMAANGHFARATRLTDTFASVVSVKIQEKRKKFNLRQPVEAVETNSDDDIPF